MPGQAQSGCFGGCALAGNGTSSRFECLTHYLAKLEKFAQGNSQVSSLVNDVTQCVERSLARPITPGKTFNCKRTPFCPECNKEKDNLIRRRMMSEIAGNGKLAESTIGGSFAAKEVEWKKTPEAIEHAIATWGNTIRTKVFKHRVAGWGRAMALKPNDTKDAAHVVINVVMRLHEEASKIDREAIFYAIAGTLAVYRYRPVKVVHLADLQKERSSLSFKAFDLANFCHLVEGPLQADPELLWPLHNALKGRRLVAFGGSAAK
ncbi:MAG: hypothetical protein K0U74_12140 [Alphaproteobacteria bacterium]|nr:hypothetical protein [Alphaproteobacteria bacterium]